ncbi:MAG TPA: murein biosynthesis integral membrane protein MurJ [Ktedonobacterales bacterium]|nr:murein biosynthesis integral membrane protein MurJ [Ktedonobacterales bacterium]
MAEYEGPPMDELDDDLEAPWATGSYDGLTEPQWAASGIATGPFPAIRLGTGPLGTGPLGVVARRGGASAAVIAPSGGMTAHRGNVTASLKATGRRLRETAVNVRILGAILTLASGTIAARALGVFNQTVISAHFGAGTAMDAYFATLALPVLLTNLVVNALTSSIVPVYIRMSKEGREREASEVLSTMLNVVLLLVGLLTAFMIVFPEPAVRLMAPGASQVTIAAGARLAPYIFPILLLNTVVGFLTAISNATRRFGFPALGAMFVPVGIFFGTVLLGDAFGVTALAMGLLAGTILQFLLMLTLTRRLQLHYRPLLRFRHPEVRTALTQFWPMLVGAAIGQANPVIDQVIASLLGAGSISALNYALKVISIPVTVIFVAYSQAIYPYFSSQAAARDYKSLKSTLSLFAWGVGFVTLGMALVFSIFSGPIVHILFRHGAFSESDATVTAATLIGFSVGLVPMAIEFMLTRTFNALQRNDILMRVSIYTMVTNIALDIVLAHFFGLPGIALATSIDYLLTAILMLAVLRGLIGRIGLFHPPEQLRNIHPFASVSMRLRRTPTADKRRFLEPIGATLGGALRNLALAIAAIAAIGAVTAYNAVQGLRLSVGAVLAVIFVRSPFGLLLTWAALGAFYSVYIFDHSLGYVLALGSLPAFALLIWHELRERRRWPPGIWAYALFLLWVLFGVKLSPLSHSQFGIDWLGYLDYALVFILAIAELRTPRRFERFVTVLLCSAMLLALLGIAEYVLRFGGFQQPGARLIYRVSGIYGWSNSYGFYLVLVLPLALYRVMTVPRGRRLPWGLVLGAVTSALLLTFVRTAFVSVFLLVLVAAFLLDRRMRRLLLRGLAVMVVLGGILLLIPGLGVQKRLLQNLTTLNARTFGWQVLLTHLHLTAPFGQGLYASIAVLNRVGLDNVRAPHSVFLQVLFDHGIAGLLFLVASLVLLIGGIVQRALRSQGNARVLAALVAGGLIGATAYVSVDNTFWVYGLGTYFWLLAALPFARAFDKQPRGGSDGRAPVVDLSVRGDSDPAVRTSQQAPLDAPVLQSSADSIATRTFDTRS